MRRLAGIALFIGFLSFGGINLELTNYTTTEISSGVVVMHSPKSRGFNQNRWSKVDGSSTTPLKEGWSIITTPLKTVEDVLRKSLIVEVKRIVDRYPDKKLAVIDWGCGDGTAINELARQARRAGINARFIGYSNLYFDRWKESEDVEFILDNMDRLPVYFENDEIGLIFSHFGMYHVRSEALVEHLNNLSTRIVSGGIIVTNTCEYKRDALINASHYYTIDTYFTTYDKVFGLTRNEVGAGVWTYSIPLCNLN